MTGGQMEAMVDAPSVSNPTQLGTPHRPEFLVHDETQLERRWCNRRSATAARR